MSVEPEMMFLKISSTKSNSDNLEVVICIWRINLLQSTNLESINPNLLVFTTLHGRAGPPRGGTEKGQLSSGSRGPDKVKYFPVVCLLRS